MIDLKQELGGIVGSENVLDAPDQLADFALNRSTAGGMPPRCVVRPQNADQVQAIVRWARKTGTPLIPVSSTGPHTNGGSAPSVPGTVIVDLSGMKRILSINRQQRMAVVEPGVTYGELSEALAKEGLEIALPIRPEPGKSVVASVLEMEPRMNALHQWNFIDPLRCTEVVWGDGNRMFTGEAGGGPKDLDAQWDAQKWQVSGSGPMMLDFYRLLTGAQGSMGIVTWASLKCEVKTSVHMVRMVSADSLKALEDFTYALVRSRFSCEQFLMNATALATLMSDSADEVVALKKTLPAWIAVVGIGGRELLPEERVEQQTADISEMAESFGLKLVERVGNDRGERTAAGSAVGVDGSDLLVRMSETNASTAWKHTAKGASRDLFFATTLDQTDAFLLKMDVLCAKQGVSSDEIGVYIQPQNMGTSMHVEFMIPYAPSCGKDTEKTQKLFDAASEAFAAMGAFYYRPYGKWAELQMNKDAQSLHILKQLKGVFDPDRILNPGKLCT